MAKLHYYRPPENAAEFEQDGCPQEEEGGWKLSIVKGFLKKWGGYGYTRHMERDGGCFETTEIKLTGNNSRVKYNRHL